jgi:hypothetical protein
MRYSQIELSKMIHWILLLTNVLPIGNVIMFICHVVCWVPWCCLLSLMFVHISFCSHNGFLCLVSIQETSNHKLDFVRFKHAMHESLQFEYFHHWKFSWCSQIKSSEIRGAAFIPLESHCWVLLHRCGFIIFRRMVGQVGQLSIIHKRTYSQI